MKWFANAEVAKYQVIISMVWLNMICSVESAMKLSNYRIVLSSVGQRYLTYFRRMEGQKRDNDVVHNNRQSAAPYKLPLVIGSCAE